MTEQSDKELQDYIDTVNSVDYHDEEVQKRTIIGHDMGASISLYSWIHRHDNPERAIVIELGKLSVESSNLWAEEFRKLLSEPNEFWGGIA